MRKEIIFTGKTIEEAVQNGCRQLGIDIADAEYEVISLPSKGFFGIGSSDAKVKLFVEQQDEETEEKPQSQPDEPQSAPKSESADADIMRVKSAAEQFLNGLLSRMGIDAAIEGTVSGGGVNFTLTGENIGIVIGYRGETLDALQYLTSLVANKGSEKHIKITIDTENYRSKREETLAKLARRTAARVVKNRRSIALEPMNANERRIIHSALQNFKGVSTHSVGEEPKRKVVIAYTGGGDEGAQKERRGRDNRSARERKDAAVGGAAKETGGRQSANQANAENSAPKTNSAFASGKLSEYLNK